MRTGQLRRIMNVLDLWASVADLVGFAAVTSAALDGPGLLTGALVVLALVMAVLPHRAALIGARAHPPEGTYLVVRFLALAAVAVGAAAATPPTVLWVLLGLLAASLAFEPLAAGLHLYVGPTVLNLPGAPRRRDTRLGGLLYVANTVAILSGTAVADGRTWADVVLTILVATALVLDAAALVDAVIGFRAWKGGTRDVAALAALEPTFAVYFHPPPDGLFHLEMWLPYLERLDEPFVVIVRTRPDLEAVRRVTDRPVVLRRAREDLDEVVVPSLRAVFYVNLAILNAHMIWYSHLTHVQLGHGDSDKRTSVNPAFKMYDKAFVAGQAGVDRFAAHGVTMPDQAFTIVGRPQVEHVDAAAGPIADIESKTVLYAPTWGGFHADVDHCSLSVGHDLVAALLERGCTVIFRPHPWNQRSAARSTDVRRIQRLLVDDARRAGRDHVHGRRAEQDLTIHECMNASDAMISDVSSVVGDYLFSRKPFAMVAVAAPAATFTDAFPVSRAGYVIDAHDGSPHGLRDALDELLVTDSLADRRAELRTYYLGDIPALDYAQRFVDEARAVIDGGRSSASALGHLGG